MIDHTMMKRCWDGSWASSDRRKGSAEAGPDVCHRPPSLVALVPQWRQDYPHNRPPTRAIRALIAASMAGWQVL
jgi:hypothetical protein